MSEQRTLVKKLAQVMQAVTHVPKDGFNKAQGYNFTQAADVLGVIRSELAKRNVIIVPTAEGPQWHATETKNGTMQLMTVRVTFKAHDGDSGESLDVGASVGEGADYGDKHAPKSQTNAMKYGLLDLFLIPQGEDPEADEETDRRTMSEPSPRVPTPARSQATTAGNLPTTFPPFGSLKGQPISEASAKDLLYYLGASKRTLADPEKSRFHAKEQALVAAYEAALLRLKNGQPDNHGYESDVAF